MGVSKTAKIELPFGLDEETITRKLLHFLITGKKKATKIAEHLNLPISTGNKILQKLQEEKKVIRYGAYWTISTGYLIEMKLEEGVLVGMTDQRLRELMEPLIEHLFEIHEWPPDWLEEYAKARSMDFGKKQAWELARKKFDERVENWIPST